MKVVIFLLCVLAVLAALAAATGATVINSVDGHTLLSRAVSALVAVYCAVAAFACVKRKDWGWWMVTVLWALALLSVLVGAIWSAMHIGLPLGGLLLGGAGELVKIGLGAWLLFRIWVPMRKQFDAAQVQQMGRNG